MLQTLQAHAKPKAVQPLARTHPAGNSKDQTLKHRTKHSVARPAGWWLACALWPAWAGAQTTPVDLDQVWRQANDLVGQFRRGHADVLKWEQAHTPVDPNTPSAAASHALDLTAPASVVEWALKNHPSTLRALNRLPPADQARVLEGRWSELDPVWSWRLDDVDEVLELAISARKAWLQATASRLALGPAKTQLDAAQVAHELGQRMVAVGNWSALALSPHQLAWPTPN